MLVKKLGKPDHEPYRIWDTISQSIGSCLVLQKKKNNQLPTFRGQFQILNKLSIQQPAVSFSVSIRFCDQLIWKKWTKQHQINSQISQLPGTTSG